MTSLKPTPLERAVSRDIYRGHIRELDGVRAVGISLVLLDHFWPPFLSPFVSGLGQLGWVAMDSFFVLSGFLITGILLDTCSRRDYFSSYYIRRTLRVFPVYYAVLAALTMTTLLRAGGYEYHKLIASWGSPVWFVAYLGNFRTAFVNNWPTALGYGPFWSLQIEEQFYLIFPVAVRLLSKKALGRLLWSAVFASPIIRLVFFLWKPGNPFLQFVLLPCRMEGLALGGLIALRFRSGPWKLGRWAPAGAALLLSITVLCSTASIPSRVNEAWSSPFNRVFGYSLSSVGCACLILTLIQFRGSAYTRPLVLAPLQYIGKISYGIYLLHLPVQLVFDSFAWHLGWKSVSHEPLHFVILVVLSVGAASASWYLFESRLLLLKDKITRREPLQAAAHL